MVKQKSKVQGGGLWRAWVRYVSYARPGTPKLSQIRASLQAAVDSGDPVLQTVQRMGEAAKANAKLKQRGKKSNFGLNSEQLKRLSLKDARQKLWGKTRNMSTAQRAREVADQSGGKGDLQSCLATARRHVYLDGVARREENAIELEALQTYACHRGKEELANLFAALPALKPLVQESLEAIPSSEALHQEWAEEHTTILEESCPTLPAGVGVTKCQKLGYCICSASGKAVFKLRSQLLSAMKREFYGKERRQRLAKADIVFMLKPIASCTHQIEASMSEVRWCHIAAMSFSPYQPIIHYLQHCSDDDDNLGLQHRCVLKGSFGFV
eukprot:2887552-Amphidinium_carterae.2